MVQARVQRGRGGRGGGAAAGRAASDAPTAQLEEADQRLCVLAGVDGAVEVVERPRHELDALVLLDGRALDVRQARGQVDMHLLVREAGGAPVGLEVDPVRGRLADLLGELAPGGVERRLALLVEPAGRDLEEPERAYGLARLADEVELLAVVDP